MNDLLFHRDTIVATLASGSRGNCTYIGDERSGVLVDCGLSTRQVLVRMAEIGLGDARIDGVLVTHEHADHVGGARILDDRLLALQGSRVPFHLTRGTKIGLDPRCTPNDIRTVKSGVAFKVGSVEVEPYAVPHDTRDPVAYLVRHRGVTVGVLTDLGRSTHLVQRQVARMDVAVIEFNHDVEMLLDGSYPWSLKQRVRGPHGHLSNDQACELVASSVGPNLSHLVLAHLSDENNHPERALDAAERGLAAAGLARVQVTVASQTHPVGPFRVSPRPVAVPSANAPRKPRRPAPRPIAGPGGQLGLFG